MKLNKPIVIKTFIFIISIFIIRFLLNIFIWPLGIYKKTILPSGFFPFTKTNLLIAGSFALFSFLIYHRNDLNKLENYKNDIKSTTLFSLLSLLSIFLYYYIRYLIKSNFAYFSNHLIQATILIIFPLILFIIFLFIAIFNFKFTKQLLIKFKKTIPLFLLIGTIYYFTSLYFQKLWPHFSAIVAKSAFYIFSLFYSTDLTFLKDNSPYLTIEDFKVIIGAPCSGIDSMLLFSTLFLLIFFLDFKRLNINRTLFLFIPGLLGIFLFNILRIFILLLVGLYISKDFAVGLFHQNIGWLLFIIYFIIFYLITRRFIYKN